MSLEASLAKALPDLRQSASPVDRITYSRDLWPRHHLAVSDGRIAEHKPGVIVWPRSVGEVESLVRFCASEGAPLVPFGAGSGVCAGVLPNDAVVVCDLKLLKRWEIHPGVGGPGESGLSPTLEVEAGALGINLEMELQARGYTLGHFPSSILCSTVGGWVAARSAGQCSGLYGKIEDMVASLDVVTGAGDLVRMHRRVHGPDLTPLMIGSEGVLGVVTSARLRLHQDPTERGFLAMSFPSVEAGFTAMRRIFQEGLRPAVSRLYDPFDTFLARRGSVKKPGKSTHSRSPRVGAGALALRTILRVPGALNGLVEAVGSRAFGGAMLVLVFEGEGAPNDLERARSLGVGLGAEDLGDGPARHWFKHRYSVSYRQAPIFMAGAFSDTMEVAAPWSRLGELYASVRRAMSPHVFVMAHLSHAYPDGCSIYFTFAGSAPSVPAAEALYDRTWREALDAVLRAGGTLSHHHGVGRSKAPRLGAELGLGVELVRAMRRALDPHAIMNPGNLEPREPTAKLPMPTAVPLAPSLDAESLLVHVAGTHTLAEVERALAPHRLSLRLGSAAPSPDTTVDAWIAGGARGAADPWVDPVDHLVAGFSAELRSGGSFNLRPSPRRAVGPDLFALFLGLEGKIGRISSAYLRAHGADQARPMAPPVPSDPALTEAERAIFDRIIEASRAVG